ncbi:MAG: hypothetical protein IJP27_09190 [Clostridia bacterium]|nr:hypothetical protein [Clostridia bacterium]
MLLHIFWVVLSLFAVIGLLGCISGVLELLALRKVRSVERAVLRVRLAGEEQYMEYLLNTLSLMVGRLDVGGKDVELVIVDGGLTLHARQRLEEYCEKNPWVVFTDAADCDTI